MGLLLQFKASVNMVDASGYTALLRASCMGRVECVRRLLGAGAKKARASRLTPPLTCPWLLMPRRPAPSSTRKPAPPRKCPLLTPLRT